MNQYEKYKPSGIEWIGEIPEHWNIVLLKRELDGLKDGTHGTYSRTNKGKPLLSAKNVYFDAIKITDNESLISEEDHDEIVKSGYPQYGDLLLTIVGTIGRCFVYNLQYPLAFQRSVLFLRFKKRVSPKYYFYFFQSPLFSNRLLSLAKTSAQSGVYMNDVAESIVLELPKQEQTAIANYLDQKTTEIDDLIAKKQKLIDLLNEEKIAIINQAVTKGLNPDTPMKDSGIPWLGGMPTHWEVRKLKYVSKINPEALTENTKEDFRFFYIDISSVDSEGNITDLIELLFKDAPSRARRIVKREDTIISTVRTYLKAIAFIQREDSNLICSTGFSVIRPDPKVFRPKFLFYLFRSDKIINAISSLSKGVSYPAIDSGDLAEIATWFPPREEQDAILNYIEANKYRIDKTISKINKEIGLLQEYRTALISEAVTGKIDVRI